MPVGRGRGLYLNLFVFFLTFSPFNGIMSDKGRWKEEDKGTQTESGRKVLGISSL
jgi:hypothetical protein